METNCDHRKCVSRIFMRCHQDQNMKNWKIIIIGDQKKMRFKMDNVHVPNFFIENFFFK